VVYSAAMLVTGWQAGLKTSVVAFDLAQFFPSINHELILSILEKQGFAPEIVAFFRSYPVGRHTVRLG
jgi:hypothetical protein